MTIDEQIARLNHEVRCTLKPSPIHGVGVFTLRDIKKGQHLYVRPKSLLTREWFTVPYSRFGEIESKVRQIIINIWGGVMEGSSFQHPNEVWLVSFMNHSDTPNSNGETALRDIAEGEEVTEDYRVLPNAKDIYPFL